MFHFNIESPGHLQPFPIIAIKETSCAVAEARRQCKGTHFPSCSCGARAHRGTPPSTPGPRPAASSPTSTQGRSKQFVQRRRVAASITSVRTRRHRRSTVDAMLWSISWRSRGAANRAASVRPSRQAREAARSRPRRWRPCADETLWRRLFPARKSRRWRRRRLRLGKMKRKDELLTVGANHRLHGSIRRKQSAVGRRSVPLCVRFTGIAFSFIFDRIRATERAARKLTSQPPTFVAVFRHRNASS